MSLPVIQSFEDLEMLFDFVRVHEEGHSNPTFKNEPNIGYNHVRLYVFLHKSTANVSPPLMVAGHILFRVFGLPDIYILIILQWTSTVRSAIRVQYE